MVMIMLLDIFFLVLPTCRNSPRHNSGSTSAINGTVANETRISLLRPWHWLIDLRSTLPIELECTIWNPATHASPAVWQRLMNTSGAKLLSEELNASLSFIHQLRVARLSEERWSSILTILPSKMTLLDLAHSLSCGALLPNNTILWTDDAVTFSTGIGKTRRMPINSIVPDSQLSHASILCGLPLASY